MDVVSSSDVRALVESSERNSVSIFLPTHRAGVDTQQDPIRLKNLLRKAEEQLTERGLRPVEAKEFLEQAHALVNDSVFWRHQADGLAIFLSPKVFRTFRVPLAVEEKVVVNDRFRVKPLLPLLMSTGRFYLLALSQGHTRFFRCSQHAISEIQYEGLVQSMEEWSQYEDPDSEDHQFRHVRTNAAVGRSGTNTGRQTLFTGHGEDEPDAKDKALQFFRILDKSLHPVLKDESAPLLLAGVEYLLPLYKTANTHRNLLDEGILGNPEGKSPQELLAQAWPLVEPHFKQAQQQALARYEDFGGTERATSEIRAIVPAAHDGRVDTLFVAQGAEIPGVYDHGSHAVTLVGESGTGGEDLVDLAVAQTLVNSGHVFVLGRDEMPGRGDLAAFFRY